MRRIVLGIVALLFTGLGLVGLVKYGVGDSGGSAAASVALRTGVLLGVLWLALPQVEQLFRRFPPWLLGTLGLGGLVLLIRPRMFIYVLPILAALLVLQLAGRLLQPFRDGLKEGSSAKKVARRAKTSGKQPREPST